MVKSKLNNTTARKLFFICIVMFLFSFALIPLYNIICDVTGLNGNTSNLKEKAYTFSEATTMESNDKLNIQFISHETIKNKLEFKPKEFEMTILPGKVYSTMLSLIHI